MLLVRIQQVLCKALEEISIEKQFHEKCLSIVVHALQSSEARQNSDTERVHFFSEIPVIQSMLSSPLMTTLPQHLPEILHWYFKEKLEELSAIMDEDGVEEQEDDCMDLDEKLRYVDEGYPQEKYSGQDKLVKNIGKVVRDLRSIGFTSMAENALSYYFWLIWRFLKSEFYFHTVPLQFLNALLSYLGDSVSYGTTSSGLTSSPLACCPSPSFSRVVTPAGGIVRWKLQLEYFAYETLQDLRIAKLFEIIVDYPESMCRQFKAFRAIDPAGVFLEAVGEPIRDTVKYIVTMLTDGSGGNAKGFGNPGDSLLEDLMRDEESQENVGFDDDFHTDDKQAWINASRWEPDSVEADLLKGSLSQRKVDILGMLVDLIGSKEQLVNEYHVMLAGKASQQD